jgi:hypothetical protein
MDVQPALALPNGLEVIGIELIDPILTIPAGSTQMCPCCPLCGTPASRVQSRSMRQVADLPCGGHQVRMQIQATQASQPPNLLPKSVALSQAKREERLAQYQQVVALGEQGFSQTAIASQVGIGHASVSRCLSHGLFPDQQPRPRGASVDPHLNDLVDRWQTGNDTGVQVHRDLLAHGSSHQENSVYRRLARAFPAGRKKRCTGSLPAGQKKQATPEHLPRPPVLARQAMVLFLRRSEELEAEEQETLTLLRSLPVEVDQADELVQQFAHMVRTRTGEQRDAWLCRVRASKIREFQGFVAGVIRDKEAVTAGLTLPQNTG